MSTENGDAPRSATTARGLKSVPHMNAVGYLVLVLMLPVLVPLAPFLAVAWLLSRRGG
ncbi:MAG: hypothetical protein ABEH77_03735 [Halobacteriaceae archaeon]